VSVRVLAVVSVALCAGAAAALLGGDWTVTCPQTGATGWMDCGGQPDARWHAEALPGWVDVELLLGAAAAGAAGLLLAVALRLRGRR
jgi:hypothetical protein